VACEMVNVPKCVMEVLVGRGALKFVEYLQISCEDEENVCCVLCGQDYCESYAWP